VDVGVRWVGAQGDRKFPFENLAKENDLNSIHLAPFRGPNELEFKFAELYFFSNVA
jgi:hypothetical protein